MKTVTIETDALRVRAVWFTHDKVYFDLQDGRTVGSPLVWFPRLLNASDPERQNWRLIGTGQGVHWPDLDEDLSAEGMFLYTPLSPNRA